MGKRTLLGDPAYWMLSDGVVSTPVVFSPDCYICIDPEYALMGLPLCRACPVCGGHIAADDFRCDGCGLDDRVFREILIDWPLTDAALGKHLLYVYLDPNYVTEVPTAAQCKAVVVAVLKEIDGKT